MASGRSKEVWIIKMGDNVQIFIDTLVNSQDRYDESDVIITDDSAGSVSEESENSSNE